MKTIIAGSRTVTDYQIVLQAIQDSGFIITEVVSGRARGVDQMGERYAREHGLPIKPFPANWDLYGKSAGPRRNAQMAEYAEALIAICENNSRGIVNMIREAKFRDLKVFVLELPGEE